MQPLGHLYIRFHTFVTVLLLGQHALAQSAALVECLQLGDSSSIFVPENCTWSSTLPAEARLSIIGARPSPGLYSSETATPVVVYSAAAGNPQPTASTTGKLTCLHVEQHDRLLQRLSTNSAAERGCCKATALRQALPAPAVTSAALAHA